MDGTIDKEAGIRQPQTVQIPVKRFFDLSDVDESFGKLTFV